MSRSSGYARVASGMAVALLLGACGAGGSGGGKSVTPPPAGSNSGSANLDQQPGAPALTNHVATDGLNWINYRRAQVGLPTLLRNTDVDRAAQGHSDYQKTNNTVTHDQTAGAPGFTGVRLSDRLRAAGYVFPPAASAYGEVISATSNSSGFYMAEELITAIYHRFVMFEPKFKEIGTGSATTSANYTYFTSNFTASNGYGPGIGAANMVTWPTNGQTLVTRNFFSDYEEPDPVPSANEVGYPISVHADLDVALDVVSFTVRARGGAALSTRLLKLGADAHTPQSAAAIIPLAVLAAATTYDVSFVGSINNVPLTKSWSFTTK